jgi:thiamine-monophosphate kinase
VVTGIGHDCAIIAPRRGEHVAWHVDDQVEDIHFRRRWATFEDVGWKAAGAALSDLAAVGARPLGVQLALQLPRELDDRSVLALARGFVRALARAGAPLVGGNVAARPRGTGLSLSVSVAGATRAGRAFMRSGARAGDRLYTTGVPGLARVGLLLLEGGERPRRGAGAAAVAKLLRPVPRLEVGLALAALPAARRPRAAIDTSDGLSTAASQLARASGLGATLDESALPRAALARAARGLGPFDATETALTGGEDYELLVAAPRAFERSRVSERFSCVGALEPGEPGTLRLRKMSGAIVPLEPTEYRHRR